MNLNQQNLKFRLYIDEVGNASFKAAANQNERYLSLTGLIFELDYVREIVVPQIEGMKARHFTYHPDEPPILHRKELIAKKPPFQALRNPDVEHSFNVELLHTIESLDYIVLIVILDKLQLKERYKVWRYDPYHYGLAVMLERFVRWLDSQSATGDVMSESRGGKEDRRLKESFTRVYREGTDYVNVELFHQRLSSKQLKIKPKQNNIIGLQLADLVAHPGLMAALARRNNKPLPDNFGGKIAAILEEKKYLRSPSGTLDGWGRKFLP